MDFIKSLMEVLLFPCLCTLLLHGVQFIKVKLNQMEVDADHALYQTYLADALDAVYKSVVKVNQTYVESLKAQDKFTNEAQSIAFKTACQTALALMGEEAVAYLDSAMDDFDLWMQVQIEAAVNDNK